MHFPDGVTFSLTPVFTGKMPFQSRVPAFQPDQKKFYWCPVISICGVVQALRPAWPSAFCFIPYYCSRELSSMRCNFLPNSGLLRFEQTGRVQHCSARRMIGTRGGGRGRRV